ncbi:MAG: hypothetical protein IPG31_00040 [Nitrosomonas sp.]|nr:hypothetical protein [Nitrosomonas sp.]
MAIVASMVTAFNMVTVNNVAAVKINQIYIINTGATIMSANTKQKYELTNESKIMPTGETVYRIRALQSFDTIHKPVKAGDLGGFVQSEDNLSHEGNCWIFDEATGYQDSHRSGDSVGYDYSMQSGNSQQSGRSQQYDYSMQFCNSRQYDNSMQYGNSQQYGNSRQYGISQQYDDSQQTGYSQQYGSSRQFGHSQQYGNSRQFEDSMQYGFSRQFDNGK